MMGWWLMERLVGQGRTADVIIYSDNKVVKVFHKECAHLADWEYDKAQSIESIGLPAPRAYGLIDIDDKKGIVYEYVQGVSMLSLMQKKPLKVAQYARLLADLHAEIHSKPMVAPDSMKDSLSATIRNVQSINEVDREAIIGYIGTLPDGDRICHYDFHPGNVLMFEGNAKVIDWMTAETGSPCADICRTSVILRSNVLPPGVSALGGIVINAFRKIFYRSYIARYLEVTGMAPGDVEQWLLPVAAARLAEGIESETPYLHGIVMRKMLDLS